MVKLFAILSLVIIYQAHSIHGYASYRSKIPNGMNVPDPCDKTGASIWQGVGHNNAGGGGARNPFGKDFDENDEVWDKTLCQKDSDGDGKTNGEELGDPDCTWTVNSVPKITTGLSHPGVCEPMSSPGCQQKNSWLTCKNTFNCPAFTRPGTKQLPLRIPSTPVPPQETTYICIGFSLPNDTDYHVIGLEPLIDNPNVLHHILLYGCTAPLEPQQVKEPWQCDMGVQNCLSLIGLWGFGTSGQCHPDEFGFPIGRKGFQYAMMQIHWNNPEKLDTYVDNSGVKLYYTSKLRPNDGHILMTGQNYLELPPGRENVVQEGVCPSKCSSLMQPKKINIAGALLHMHLLGKSGEVVLRRNGKEPVVLVNETTYDYNTPIMYTFDKPIEFNAGDEIYTKCVYQTTKMSRTIMWGEGTQEEMCYSFITVYPYAQGFDRCGQWQDMAFCSLFKGSWFDLSGCDIQSMGVLASDPVLKAVCDEKCSPACVNLLIAISSTKCMDQSTSTGRFLNMFDNGAKSSGNAMETCRSKMPDITSYSKRITQPKALIAILCFVMLFI